MVKWILLILFAVVIVIQFIPVDRSNPAAAASLQAADEVVNILKKSCFDCHSNSTSWPWYSKVAPVSFFIAHHVEEGRDELNFSVWQEYPAEKKRKKIDELWEQIEKGEMPLKSYLVIHKNSRLSQADKEVLKSWTQSFLEPDSEDYQSADMENYGK